MIALPSHPRRVRAARRHRRRGRDLGRAASRWVSSRASCTWAVGLGVVRWAGRDGQLGDARRPLTPAVPRCGPGSAGSPGSSAAPPSAGPPRSSPAPTPSAVQEAAATDLGAEYMELVRRAYHPERSGDLQLAARAVQQRELRAGVTVARAAGPADEPRQRVDVPGADPARRVRPRHRGAGRLRRARDARRPRAHHRRRSSASTPGRPIATGRALPGLTDDRCAAPKVVVTFVIDGGGWNVLAALARSLAAPRSADARGHELPRRDHGLVPRGDRVRARHDRYRRVPARARDHRAQHPRRRGGRARPTGTAAGPTPPTSRSRRSRTCGTTRPGAWVGEIGYQVWHLGMLGRGGRGRGPATCRSACTSTRTTTGGVGAPQPRPLPAPRGGPGARGVRGAARRVRRPRLGPAVRAGGATDYCCAPPIAGYQGDLLEATLDARADRRAVRTSLLYTTFKSPDYTGHVYGMDSEWTGMHARGGRRPRSAGSVRSSTTGSRGVRADRDGRPRSVSAARRGRRRPAGPDPARARSSSRSSAPGPARPCRASCRARCTSTSRPSATRGRT